MQINLLLAISVICLSAACQSSSSPSVPSQPQTQTSVSEQKLRSVEGQTLKSDAMPAVNLKFDDDFKYVGGQDFILYDVARAEQHFFVDADAQGRIKRLYWIQFEGYLPSNNHTYDYKIRKSVNIGGLDFIADAYARNIKADPGRPDSDGSRARTFLETKGFRIPSNEVISQRLVHMVDDSKRSELMVIYLEDLGRMKLTAAALEPGGAAAARWDDISGKLLERALKGMKVSKR
ncbi:MAG: hypothetical protein QOJ64_283 [Acidobacteriota bacterium]|nr:hypothetical protein [Acidobacteriota bacterium]